MSVKVLGKISEVKFGFERDYHFLFGLHLCFEMSNGCSICWNNYFNTNIEAYLQNKTPNPHQSLSEAYGRMASKTASIMKEAKVYDIKDLKSKPVEVILSGDGCGASTVESWRILTEVL